MEYQEILGSGNGPPVDYMPVSDYNFDVGHGLDNDESSYDKFLDEVDSYWDDINSRLTVSRMVGDSVIKGIVTAIEAEAAERVASKDAEILVLNKKLQSYGSVMTKEDQLDETTRKLHCTKLSKLSCERLERNCIARLNESELVAQNYLKRLKEEITNIRDAHVLSNTGDCSADKDFCRILDQKLIDMDRFADSLQTAVAAMHRQFGRTCLSLQNLSSEQAWEQNFQQEIIGIIVQNLLVENQNDFESNISKQNVLVDTLTKNWKKTVDHILTMRQELDDISSSLLSSEQGLVVPHHSPPDLAKRTVVDFPQLKHLTKDEQIAYYKNEITSMKRQHELALQEKTEELFSLKRDYLKEKGYSALHFKKDKENELLRKKIIGFISTLDNILLENEKLSIVQSHQDLLNSLNKRIDILMFENQQLKSLLVDRAKEVIGITSEVQNCVSQSEICSQDEDLLDHRKELKLDMEDLESNTIIRDQIHKIVLRGLVGELKDDMEYFDFKRKIAQRICFTLCREYIKDVISSLNTSLEKHYKEKDSLAAALVEKEKALSLERQEYKKLKQEREMLKSLVDEKDKLLAETVIELTAQKEHNDKVCHEVIMLKEQLGIQLVHITEYRKDNASMKEKLSEALLQVQQYESEVRKISKNYNVTFDALKELEKQKICLDDLVAEKQMELASAIAREQEYLKLVTTMTSCISKLSESTLDLECRFTDKLGTIESRLEFLSHQFSDILTQVNSLVKKACWYKQGFERKCCDLQKAETEVDLLGDEVDVLLRLLEKIYLALEHYSPVLQHYPGVVEILKVIRREMKSNTT